LTDDPAGRERVFLLTARLAARTAHELNNALAVLSGHLYLLRTSSDSPEESYQAMEKSLAHVRRLAESLSQLGLLGAGETQAFELNDLVRSAAENLTNPVRLDLSESLPILHGRPNDVAQVLDALLANANEASPSGAEVRVVTRAASGDTAALLVVEDRGSGLAPEIRDRVFDPFLTTKGERGRGIGLTCAAAAAAAWGGTCQIEDREEGGSRATLSFPLPGSQTRSREG
jgi:signal transduction histidine kinase